MSDFSYEACLGAVPDSLARTNDLPPKNRSNTAPFVRFLHSISLSLNAKNFGRSGPLALVNADLPYIVKALNV